MSAANITRDDINKTIESLDKIKAFMQSVVENIEYLIHDGFEDQVDSIKAIWRDDMIPVINRAKEQLSSTTINKDLLAKIRFFGINLKIKLEPMYRSIDKFFKAMKFGGIEVVRKWAAMAFEFINTHLGSLKTVLPQIEGLKEFKEVLKTLTT
jgi:hypothetical protein